MSENLIYETIAKRTGGDVYVGVVGPVRSGKSTFIRKFMESVAIPNINDTYDKERTLDEIPQSGSGKTITTTEPKFVPADAVHLNICDTEINLRMIDCVGYMVDGAMGAMEDGEWRMVVTPWSEDAMTFAEAAEIGTEKVVREHSTIAVLVTTDGTITDIPRESYVGAEERVAKELKEAGKPFAVVLNSRVPDSPDAKRLAEELEEKYNVPVALVNCTDLNAEDVEGVLGLVVGQFPIRELSFVLPEWTELLPPEHKINHRISELIEKFSSSVERFDDAVKCIPDDGSLVKVNLDAGCGKGCFDLPISKDEYFEAMSELSGVKLESDKEIFSAITDMARIKAEYEKIKEALREAKENGYGIVMPERSMLRLSEPEITKQGSSFGIKISAAAESIHMIKTEIRAEVCPTFGTREQCEEVIRNMKADFEDDPTSLLDTKLFGRSLYELVNDGMYSKLMHLPDESRLKMGQTIEKIINEGAAGLICILI